jgi:hypothetical protein
LIFAEVTIMPIPLDAPEILNREFLEIRARLLQVAAALDRMNRGNGSVTDDPRVEKIRQGLAILMSQEPNRAEQIQLLFSRAYADDWQTALGVRPK